jgi:hypothetical protein
MSSMHCGSTVSVQNELALPLLEPLLPPLLELATPEELPPPEPELDELPPASCSDGLLLELRHPPATPAATDAATRNTPKSTFCLITSAPRSYAVIDSEIAPVAKNGRTRARVPGRIGLPVRHASILGSQSRLTKFLVRRPDVGLGLRPRSRRLRRAAEAWRFGEPGEGLKGTTTAARCPFRPRASPVPCECRRSRGRWLFVGFARSE